jgi:CDP-paratose 2-epimerase
MVDYARIYGLKTVVFRKSCIYGYHQFGNEDQGWAAHFAIMAARGRPITIYGDGRQVRDLLFISDLLRAYDLALEGIEKTAGQVYNIGGGPGHRISLLNLIDMLEKKTGRSLEYSFAPWRPGDQKVYISNIRKARSDFGWEPETPVAAGISRLLGWVQSNNPLFA